MNLIFTLKIRKPGENTIPVVEWRQYIWNEITRKYVRPGRSTPSPASLSC